MPLVAFLRTDLVSRVNEIAQTLSDVARALDQEDMKDAGYKLVRVAFAFGALSRDLERLAVH